MNGKKIFLLFLAIIVAGVLLASSTWRQWNDNQKTILQRMRPIAPMATYSQGGSINYIDFDPKNPELIAAAGSSRNFVKVWNVSKQDTPQLTLKTQKGHNGTNFVVGLGFSPVNDWIAIKGFWTLEIWDSTTGNKINTLNTASSNFAISPLCNNFALDHNHLKLWDVNDPKNITGKILLPPKMGWVSIPLDGLERIDPFPEMKISMLRHNIPNRYRNASTNEKYRAIDFSHDGRWLAAAGQMLNDNKGDWRQKVKIWDMETHQLNRIIEREEPKIQEPKRKGKKVPSSTLPLSNDIRSIKFSPDNRFFGLAADNGLTIWSLPEWDIYHEVLDKRISDIAFSPDGTLYAVADVNGINLWSVETLTPVALLSGAGLFSNSVIEFSPDGSMIAGGGMDGVVWLWDVRKLNEK
ncbi:MAG: hypothetical protein OXM61_08370 [Candidatus Poribacteria bacterium]|nr:hypothetical protein [Candidatus Poribacteria bacterium]